MTERVGGGGPRTSPPAAEPRGNAIHIPDSDAPVLHDDVPVVVRVPLTPGRIPEQYLRQVSRFSTPAEAANFARGLRPDGAPRLEALTRLVDAERAKLGGFEGGQIAAILEGRFKGGCRVADNVPRMAALAALLTGDAFARMNESQRQAMLRLFNGNLERYRELRTLPAFAEILMSPAVARLAGFTRGKAQAFLLAALGDRAAMGKLEELIRSEGFTPERRAALVQQLIDALPGPAGLERPRAVADVLGDATFRRLPPGVQGRAWVLLSAAWGDPVLFAELKTLVTSAAFAADPAARGRELDALAARVEAFLRTTPPDPRRATCEGLLARIRAAPRFVDLQGPRAQLAEWLLFRARDNPAVLEAAAAEVASPAFAAASDADTLARLLGLLQRIEPPSAVDRTWVYVALDENPSFARLPRDLQRQAFALLLRIEGTPQFEPIRARLASPELAALPLRDQELELLQHKRTVDDYLGAACQEKAPLVIELPVTPREP